MQKGVLFFLIISALSVCYAASVTVTETPVAGQAKDMRLGVHIGNGATRYSTNMYDNFIGNGDFEDPSEWTQFPMNDKWNGAVPGLAYSYDKTEFFDGTTSLKVVASAGAAGSGVGQWESNKEYQNGRQYVFSCYMRQEGMQAADNVQLQLRITDTGTNCPGGFTHTQAFSVTGEWQKHEMTFTMDKDCKPRDPAQGGANSKRINLLSAGILYIDRCILYDKEQMTPWMLNKEYIELLKDLRPMTIRYGALDANELAFNEMVGDVWGRPKDRAGIAEYLQLAKLVNADPELVLSVVYSNQDYSNLMEFIFGPPDTEYGSRREQLGYPAWDFERFYYELGNELMCRSTSMSSPGPCEWPGASYGDWSTPRINLFKSNPYWDAGRDKIGFNVWYDSSKLNAALLEKEKGNSGGGNADFIMPAKYFDGSDSFSVSSTGVRTDYSDAQLTSDPKAYFRFSFGTAALMKTYIDYFSELTQNKYGKKLEFGIYEYGPTGYPSGKSTALFNLEKTLAFGVSWLDMSLALKEHGAEAINIFYYQGSLDSYSWSLVDAYPYERKRPSYYLFSMYGQYVRGQMLERQVDVETFDPFGPGADQVNSFGCSRGGSNCQNSNWGLTNWKYPVDVPLVEVYPFRSGQRYSFVIINRDLDNARQLVMDLPYSPSPEAFIHSVTGNSPTLTNEVSENVRLQTSAINDFADGYTLTIQPYSAYVIVNYAAGAEACLDEDFDGYPDNQYEDACGSTAVDCSDFNQYVYPGNSNHFCDCDNSDGSYVGGFEISDGMDNDCDGSVDNGPKPCTTASQLQVSVRNWRAGSLSMAALMIRIKEWKNGC